jgi:UDP-glucose 4-epimerase
MSFQKRGLIFRLANIVGERSQHGVVKDFVAKLRDNPDNLEILGDGSQTKSYLYVDDCVDGIITGVMRGRGKVSTYNIGARDFISVGTIAKLVTSALGLSRTKQVFTGGVDSGRGWAGDVKTMLLDIRKLSDLGWNPSRTSEESIELTAKLSLELSPKWGGALSA